MFFFLFYMKGIFLFSFYFNNLKKKKNKLIFHINEVYDKSSNFIIFLNLVDTFIAMGGGPGVEGTVKKQKIIDIIKNEFELTFDVEELLDEINSGNDELDFKSFCQLFESAAEDSKSGISRQSFLSVKIL